LSQSPKKGERINIRGKGEGEETRAKGKKLAYSQRTGDQRRSKGIARPPQTVMCGCVDSKKEGKWGEGGRTRGVGQKKKEKRRRNRKARERKRPGPVDEKRGPAPEMVYRRQLKKEKKEKRGKRRIAEAETRQRKGEEA